MQCGAQLAAKRGPRKSLRKAGCPGSPRICLIGQYLHTSLRQRGVITRSDQSTRSPQRHRIDHTAGSKGHGRQAVGGGFDGDHAKALRVACNLPHGEDVQAGSFISAGQFGSVGDDAQKAQMLANARRVVDRYASYDPLWVTFNEPSFYTVQEMQNGGLLPLLLPVMTAGLVRAHNTIYDYIHAHQPGAMVTSNVAYIPTVEPVLDLLFLDQVARRLDFIGLEDFGPAEAVDAEFADCRHWPTSRLDH